MRDIFTTLVIFGSIPLILRRPWIGILLWCWISYMNPHRLSWGFAYNFPFAQVIVLATLIGMVSQKVKFEIPWTRESKWLLAFVLWMCVTTGFAYYPDAAWEQLVKVLKIQFMTFITLILINSRERVIAMVWAIALSLGFFGIKGGIFTLINGGAYRVQGPPGTFIGGNNELALALVMCIPLIRFLQLNTSQAWLRMGLGGAILFSAIAAIGSHSRGALLAMGIMGGFFWLKSRKKFMTACMIVAAVGMVIAIMPAEYYERMNTIKTYDEDESAMGRINAWWFAYNLAMERPLVGGGFETFHPHLFYRLAPNPLDYHDVHSIYFEVLGEHGFVGLFMFLLLALMAWRTATRVRKRSAKDPALKWMADLMAMVQVSMAGYAAGGAFLGLAYFDLYYHLVALIVVSAHLLDAKLDERERERAAGLVGPPHPVPPPTGQLSSRIVTSSQRGPQ
ncbi:putative O-glycosylation ligase, exosortase A system-associated [Methyloversatilis sp. XJ19-13]|uniref:putative O-glycosylation ligase, exosortase A system-associated n=1 Tax=Methyloversatilis sp. XJ19-13 TaxID=2963430 RepID=UPI00211D0ACC|nr:putative O-glycosylation ligase, exosortase A system-associated [Methyloversatilis sp. XJ19-13]